MAAARVGVGGNEESGFNGYRVLVWEEEKVLGMDGGDRLCNVSIFNATEALFTRLVISDSLQPHRL